MQNITGTLMSEDRVIATCKKRRNYRCGRYFAAAVSKTNQRC